MQRFAPLLTLAVLAGAVSAQAWIAAGAPAPAARPARPAGAGKLDPAELQQARAVLRTHCFSCHGLARQGGIDYILNAKLLKEKKKILAGNAKKSRLMILVRKGTMPPDTGKKRPSPADVAALEKWIAAGAPDFPNERR
jgi:mono/diheme cytochrome c family protein